VAINHLTYHLCTCGCAETKQEKRGPHLGDFCAGCGKWLRWLPQNSDNWREFVMPFGKYRGFTLANIALDDPEYLTWAAEKLTGTIQRRCKQAADDMKTAIGYAQFYLGKAA
jgi:uncharacterized protein (DUF3820 family)